MSAREVRVLCPWCKGRQGKLNSYSQVKTGNTKAINGRDGWITPNHVRTENFCMTKGIIK
jgi:hypothetical protein